MERLCGEHAIPLGNITREREELRDFMEQNQLQPENKLPDMEALNAQTETLKKRLQALKEEESEITRQYERLSNQTQKIPDLEDQVRYLTSELKTAQGNLNILRRTAEFLSASKDALSTRYLDGMQKHFVYYLSLLDGPGAPAASMDGSLGVSVRDGGKSRDIESYSRGSRDILQFCARLALTKSMFPEGEEPFLLLDDPFVNLDDEHFSAVRSLLDRLAPEFQILYFVCHTGRT